MEGSRTSSYEVDRRETVDVVNTNGLPERDDIVLLDNVPKEVTAPVTVQVAESDSKQPSLNDAIEKRSPCLPHRSFWNCNCASRRCPHFSLPFFSKLPPLMGHSNVWNSHPKTYGPGSRTCRVCGNSHGLMRKYGLMCCRQCFHSNANEIGFIMHSSNGKMIPTVKERRWVEFKSKGEDDPTAIPGKGDGQISKVSFNSCQFPQKQGLRGQDNYLKLVRDGISARRHGDDPVVVTRHT
ncbi:hypothetical protein L2E82_16262 [Cichorium intybus]|uniref:Uncharacterized protein n=1 Tax=Cichorium intybus TaxID=13427 RepID=A0ACB9F5K7_CICIN|nr:hypothetical protein L2E82_16262 [Cichorium intybus]